MTVYRNLAESGVSTLVIQEFETYQPAFFLGSTLPIARLLARADD